MGSVNIDYIIMATVQESPSKSLDFLGDAEHRI